MTPSLPIERPMNISLIEVNNPLPCAMLRFGLPCGNDAYSVILCPIGAGLHCLIPFCQMCVDDATESAYQATGQTWLELLETAVRL